MKNTTKFLCLLAGLVTVFVLHSCNNQFKPVLNSENGVNFKTTSLNEAKQIAKTENKPLFVFVHATWCGVCKQMENEVLNQAEIGGVFNAKFVNLAVDIDSEEGKKISKDYEVTATPTMFFFNADGSLAKKIMGFNNQKGLITEANNLFGDKQ